MLRESLHNYIANVKEAASILRILVSESETVKSILNGLNPETRSCLVLCERPSTFLGLEKLSIQVMKVKYTDKQRSSAELGSTNEKAKFIFPICYYCKKPGHILAKCFKRKANESWTSALKASQANSSKFSSGNPTNSKNS